MGGLQGPDESNGRWAPQPGDGTGAVPAGSEQQRVPHPYPADVYGAPGTGHGVRPGQNPAWGQPGPGAPGPHPQWGGGQAWQPTGPAPQWNPQTGGAQPQPWGPQPGYPQPQFGGQPSNQWAPPPVQPTGGKPKVGMWVGIGLVAVAALAAVGLILSNVLGDKTLDRAAAQRGVQQIVTESYGARSVTDVSCPSGQKVERGRSFDCSLTVDGSPRKVTVTFTDNDGTYEVGRPK